VMLRPVPASDTKVSRSISNRYTVTAPEYSRLLRCRICGTSRVPRMPGASSAR
jgi:hypothetical protein